MQLKNTKLHCNDTQWWVLRLMCQDNMRLDHNHFNYHLIKMSLWLSLLYIFAWLHNMITDQFKNKSVKISRAVESRALNSHLWPKITLPGYTYATKPVTAAAYPHYRLVSCSGRRAMISPGSNWLNRQIICRQKSKQTGKIKLLSVIILPCLIFGRCSQNQLRDTVRSAFSFGMLSF